MNRVLGFLAVISLLGSGAVALLLSGGPAEPVGSYGPRGDRSAAPALRSPEALLADRLKGWGRGQVNDVQVRQGRTHDLEIRIQVINEPLIAQDQIALGLELKERHDINPSQECWTCHR